MPSFTSSVAAAALLSAATVRAHGHVTDIIVDQAFYQGWDINKGMGYNDNYPDVVGWSNKAMDNGFVGKESFATPDIVCHLSANASTGYATVAAGSIVQLDWTAWPESHKGPVIDYMAPCPDAGCGTVDKTSLEWFKISQVGLIDNSMNSGYWGSDLMIKNNNSWQVQIPSSIAPGLYVLRNEIIAMHSTGSPQNYPQCVTIKVTGTGTDKPSGTVGEKLYTDSDPIWDFSLYTSATAYDVPGPALIPGATPIIDQKSVAPASTIEPTPISGGVSGAEPTNAGGSSSAPAAGSTTTTPAASEPTYGGDSSAAGSSTSAAAPVVPTTPAATEPSYGAAPTSASPAVPTSASGSKTCSKKRRRSHARDVRSL
ncbi:hypothetical protein BROUX41_005888 [Berkeleyomyces rouxiae]|uniref:uncharacterized protein n=1 Tax=Berkeleyomyces rouxiae TaxID=2035830 RepID=UPI003B80863C